LVTFNLLTFVDLGISYRWVDLRPRRSTFWYSNQRLVQCEAFRIIIKLPAKQKAFKSSDLKALILAVIPLGLSPLRSDCPSALSLPEASRSLRSLGYSFAPLPKAPLSPLRKKIAPHFVRGFVIPLGFWTRFSTLFLFPLLYDRWLDFRFL
jgi:hypothetical protein